MRIGFLLTNVSQLTDTWTSTHLALAALHQGHEVCLLEPWGCEVTERGRLVARAWVLDTLPSDGATLLAGLRGGEVLRRFVEVEGLDLLFMRVNPLTPHALQVALAAQAAGVRVTNDPRGTLLTRSKAWLATLGDVPRPPTVVTTSLATAESFAHRHASKRVVVKPAQASGGRGVSLVRPRARSRLREAFVEARSLGGGAVVVQTYIEGAEDGEKRIVWVDGEILGVYLRRRGRGEFRHNLKRGAQPARCALSAGDLQVVERITPHLLRHGIRLAGLDVIAEHVVEANTVNPGGLHWSDVLADQPGTLAARAISLLARDTPTCPSPPSLEDSA